MIVLFMVVSMCYWMRRSDVSVIPFRTCLFFKHSCWPFCCHGFLTFACLWEISFFSKVISGTVSWLLGLDRIFK